MYAKIFSLTILCALLAGPAQAQSLRCGDGSLVVVGDAKAGVLQKCGEPKFKDSFCKPGTERNEACERIDEWTYSPGPGQFLTTVRLEAGKDSS